MWNLLLMIFCICAKKPHTIAMPTAIYKNIGEISNGNQQQQHHWNTSMWWLYVWLVSYTYMWVSMSFQIRVFFGVSHKTGVFNEKRQMIEWNPGQETIY